MDKGLRQGVNAKFAQMLPLLPALGGKAFRRQILDWTVEQYGATMASASTHYNFAFQAAKKATPELVAGLGRPEGKNNGGRKKKAAEGTMPAGSGSDYALGIPASTVSELTPDVETQTEFSVRKKSDDTVIASGLSFEAAKALVDKAAAAKKAKLYYV